MSNYRRDITPGGTWFFTVVTWQRKPWFAEQATRQALRSAIIETQNAHPFSIDAWVLLPDHLHCIWTLPDNDHDFSIRWSMIKRLTSKACMVLPPGAHGAPYKTPPTVGCAVRTTQSASRQKRRELPFWQRRFWEHALSSEEDFNRHCDYIHYNPIKHGYVKTVSDWPYSTFFRFLEQGMYPADWGNNMTTDREADYGEPV